MANTQVPEKLKRHGIYIIRIGHAPNFRAAYVGSTTESFWARWKRHLRKLSQQKHPNSDLQTFYNEDPDQLHFDILETLRTKDDKKMGDTERRWFELLKPHITIINHQTPRYSDSPRSKRGRRLRQHRKEREERAKKRIETTRASAIDELMRQRGEDPNDGS